MTITRTFLDYVKMAAPDRKSFCRRCNKSLLVDVGVAQDGIPGAWAFCRKCKTYYCPVNHKHVLGRGHARWMDGVTLHGASKVANCLQGTCENQFDALEKVVIAVTRYPRGPSTVALVGDWSQRVGSSLWGCQAQVVLDLFEFKTKVEPVWISEESAARREAEIAAEKAHRAAAQLVKVTQAQARQQQRQALSEAAGPAWEAYVASGASQLSEDHAQPSLQSLLAMLPSGAG